MASDATEPMLVTFRVSSEQLAATMLRLREDRLMKEQLELVSVRRESEDLYTDNDPEDEAALEAMDGERVVSSIIRGIDSFMGDAPDSNYLCGYLEALVILYREGLGLKRNEGDARIWAAEWLISNAYVSEERSCAESGQPAEGAQ